MIRTVKGDITKIRDVQAIVNAANNSIYLAPVSSTIFYALLFIWSFFHE